MPEQDKAAAEKRKLIKGRHKSAQKRARQTVQRAARNASWRSQVKTIEKKVLVAIQKKDVNSAKEALETFMSTIDRAAQKGAVHVKRAARRIGRLSSQINRI